jgi:hypothetical protein
MATQFAPTFTSPAPLPFLLRKRAPAKTGGFAAAIETAIAAERAEAEGRKSCQRIARFLCELGKAYGCRKDLPLSRGAIAAALKISLVRVKRTLGLLSLSGVLRSTGDTITILDWRKLGGVAHFDPSGLGLADDEDEELICSEPIDEDEVRIFTASGDPACFV